MRDNAPDETAEKLPVDPAVRAPKLDRAFSRQLFREMIKMQIDEGPLRRGQRRDLIRFARRMNLDTFEARLIIRAVEYECGVAAPAELDDRETTAETRWVIPVEESLASYATRLMTPLAILVAVLLAWVAVSGL